MKINFDRGNLSFNAGLILIKEFICKIVLDKLISKHFQTVDNTIRTHKDVENLLQKIYQQLAGYFMDDDSDELTVDPIFTNLLDKRSLASQPTMSCFFNRMDEIISEKEQKLENLLFVYLCSFGLWVTGILSLTIMDSAEPLANRL